MPAPLAPTNSNNQLQNAGPKNVKRKSSKPFIDWLQRKLAGTARHTRRASVGAASHDAQNVTVLSDMPSRKQSAARSDRTNNGRSTVAGRRGFSNEISLNTTDENFTSDLEDTTSTRVSSLVGVSLWSRSNAMEADEDASVRPLPPTSPPSPSPSRSSSSYVSDPATFKSMSVSTKPTTLLSIDVAGANGMAHIAQAPPTPSSTIQNIIPSPGPAGRFPPHIRTSSTLSTGAITFSALPPSPQSSRPASLTPLRIGAVQAPQHTSHHPRNNPRPASPPLDNASVLTLASSAFAFPAARPPYAWPAGGDSVSHLGANDSMSQILLDDGLFVEDRDASMRALRPRSSRRNSWESEASRWSARLSGSGAAGGYGRERSVRTAQSFRTGGLTMDDADGSMLEDEDDMAGDDAEEQDDLDLEMTHSPVSMSTNDRATLQEEDNGTQSDHATETSPQQTPSRTPLVLVMDPTPREEKFDVLASGNEKADAEPVQPAEAVPSSNVGAISA